MARSRKTMVSQRRPGTGATEVSDDEEERLATTITISNWQQELPWTKLASHEQPEVGQIGLIIKGKEKDGLGKMVIVLRVHAVKITVGYWCPKVGTPRTSLREPASLMWIGDGITSGQDVEGRIWLMRADEEEETLG
jgi:hypothetical protein